MRIVVTGLIGQYPIGGVTWDYFQYVLGFHRLGHEVYYLEDTGQWPYQPVENALSKDPSYTVEYIDALMRRFGLGDRWAYCYPHERQWFGMSESRRTELIENCDLLLNVSGVLYKPDAYRGRGKLVYLDSDPVFTQVKVAAGQDYVIRLLEAHDQHFSFGEALAGTDHSTPHTDFDWIPTRQPIVLDEWQTDRAHGDKYTTIMSWKAYNPVEFEGRVFGQKDLEFMPFVELPSLVAPAQLEVAANHGKRAAPKSLLAHKGWSIADPVAVSRDIDCYRDYIHDSKGEWSVAKNGYVQGQSGWFSCRSACYLAAGRPVVVQETGFSKVLPVGEGLLSFSNLEEAADALSCVEADYEQHARRAAEIAREYFDCERVLGDLLARAFAATP